MSPETVSRRPQLSFQLAIRESSMEMARIGGPSRPLEGTEAMERGAGLFHPKPPSPAARTTFPAAARPAHGDYEVPAGFDSIN